MRKPWREPRSQSECMLMEFLICFTVVMLGLLCRPRIPSHTHTLLLGVRYLIVGGSRCWGGGGGGGGEETSLLGVR